MRIFIMNPLLNSCEKKIFENSKNTNIFLSMFNLPYKEHWTRMKIWWAIFVSFSFIGFNSILWSTVLVNCFVFSFSWHSLSTFSSSCSGGKLTTVFLSASYYLFGYKARDGFQSNVPQTQRGSTEVVTLIRRVHTRFKLNYFLREYSRAVVKVDLRRCGDQWPGRRAAAGLLAFWLVSLSLSQPEVTGGGKESPPL